MSIDDQIAAAGSMLARAWKGGANPQQPENDLHPDASKLAFRLKLAEDRISELYELNRKLLAGLREKGIIR
jgi:hypothetical protein